MDFTYEKPDDDAFFSTLLLYLKLNGPKELYSLLIGARCGISVSTSFSRKRWNAYWAEVRFYIPVEKLDLAKEGLREKLAEICDRIMPVEAGLDIMKVEFAPLISPTFDGQGSAGKQLAQPVDVQPATILPIPSEDEILDICKKGEDQIHEFKAEGTEIQKLTKEIAAFANTRRGGLIFYGVEDDGTITGTDKRRQEVDQPLQNSIRNTISPSLMIDIIEKDVSEHRIILVRIPAWNRQDVFHYEGRVYLRHGTNGFVAKPEESKKLHKGIPIT